MEKSDSDDLLQATTHIAVAYLSRNSVTSDQLLSVLQAIHESLQGMGRQEVVEASPPVPAVSIRRSVTQDSVVCIECGRAMKFLKRHLRENHGLTVPEYRAKWRLAADHPLVAPNHARMRSEAAKRIGLGRAAPLRRSRKRNKAHGDHTN